MNHDIGEQKSDLDEVITKGHELLKLSTGKTGVKYHLFIV